MDVTACGSAARACVRLSVNDTLHVIGTHSDLIVQVPITSGLMF